MGKLHVIIDAVHIDHALNRRVSNVASGPVSFGVIPRDHWFQPDWVDEAKAKAGRNKMVAENIIYGGMFPISAFLHSYLPLSFPTGSVSYVI